VVDMSKSAVTCRLRELSRLLRERGFIPKAIVMTKEAVTTRLKMMGALSDLCRRLGRVGEQLRRGSPKTSP
jgi:hypothetical protein